MLNYLLNTDFRRNFTYAGLFASQGASAGNYTTLEITNPSDSEKLLVVHKIVIEDAGREYYAGLSTTTSLDVTNIAVSYGSGMSISGAVTPAATVERGHGSAQIGSVTANSPRIYDPSVAEGGDDIVGWVHPVAPGQIWQLQDSVVNQAMNVNVWWYEFNYK